MRRPARSFAAVAVLSILFTAGVEADDERESEHAIPPPPDMTALDARCRKPDVATCATIAELYTLGTKIERDLPRARSAWQRTCDLGDKVACARAKSIASLLVNEAACARTGDARACFAAGMGYAEFDRNAALPGLGKACKAGREDACSMYLRARVLLGHDDAVTVMERRCLVDDRVDDCVQIGRWLGERDTVRAMPVIDKACTLDDAEACLVLGRAMRDRVGQIGQAQRRLDDACRIQGPGSVGCKEAAALRKKSRSSVAPATPRL